jgi:hypothetical protein
VVASPPSVEHLEGNRADVEVDRLGGFHVRVCTNCPIRKTMEDLMATKRRTHGGDENELSPSSTKR